MQKRIREHEGSSSHTGNTEQQLDDDDDDIEDEVEEEIADAGESPRQHRLRDAAKAKQAHDLDASEIEEEIEEALEADT